MRSKDAYEIEKSDTGKINVKKIGVGAQQRSGFEFEFSLTFSIDQKTNLAEVQKDNTHLFENEGAVLLNEKHGKDIINWANSGEGYTPPVRDIPSNAEILLETKKVAVERCKQLGGSKNETLMVILKEYEPTGNPNKINDLEKLQELISKLSVLETP